MKPYCPENLMATSVHESVNLSQNESRTWSIDDSLAPKREAPASLRTMRRRPVELDERPAAPASPASQPEGQKRTPMWLYFMIALLVFPVGALLIARLLQRD